MNATRFVRGSRELMTFAVTAAPPLTLTEWTAELAFTRLGSEFDAANAVWRPAVLVAGTQAGQFGAEVMHGPSGAFELAPGSYSAHLRLTHAPDGPSKERPVIAASGRIEIVTG